jgi:hypothetical protein
MSEQEWLNAGNVDLVWSELVRTGVSERKLRLFAIAYFRSVFGDYRGYSAEDISTCEERFREFRLSFNQLVRQMWASIDDAERRVDGVADGERPPGIGGGCFGDYDLGYYVASFYAEAITGDIVGGFPEAVKIDYGCRILPKALPLIETDRAQRARMLVEVIGNSFRPIAIDPLWLSWDDGTVRQLAERIYEERAFERMPTLGDALEDAGCTDEDILNHCRQSGLHFRGCWCLDLLLGKK